MRSGRNTVASRCNPVQPLAVVAGWETAWAASTLVARAATETCREGRENAPRDRRDGVEGFERAWARSGLVAVGARLARDLAGAGRAAVIVSVVGEGGGRSDAGGRRTELRIFLQNAPTRHWTSNFFAGGWAPCGHSS